MLPGVILIVTVQLFYRHEVHKRLKYFQEREGERERGKSAKVITEASVIT